MDGWKPKITGYEAGDNFGNTFRVEDGVLKVSYDKYSKFDGKFGHLFYKTPFSHYKLHIEYRFVGDQCPGGPSWALRNSGVMIHGQSPESMGKDQDFPVSIEVQFLGGNGKGRSPHLQRLHPGHKHRHARQAHHPALHEFAFQDLSPGRMGLVDVEVHGNGLIKHMVDGETVIEYEKPQLDEKDADAKKLIKNGEKMLQEGTISLQSESHPIEFRKVELLPLKE